MLDAFVQMSAVTMLTDRATTASTFRAGLTACAYDSGRPPDGGLRPARAAGPGGVPPPLPRHPSRAGGVGDHGEQPAATARADVPHASQRVLPTLRRPRPDPARHAARLRDRTESPRRAPGAPRRRAGARAMTPRDALLDLVARVGGPRWRGGASQRDRTTPVASGGRWGPAGAPAPGPGASRHDRDLSRL